MINVQAVHAHATQYISRVRPLVDVATSQRRRGRGRQQPQESQQRPQQREESAPQPQADPAKKARMREMVEAARRLETEATYRSNLPIQNRGK